MIKTILRLFPLEYIIKYFIAKVTNYSYKRIDEAVDYAVDFVVRVEKEYGPGNGDIKSEEVKKLIKNNLHIGTAWILNLLVEVAVGIAKKKGYI